MDKTEVKQIWSDVKNELRSSLPDHVYYSWVDSLSANNYENEIFTLNTVYAIAPQLIKQNHNEAFLNAFKKILGKNIAYNIIYDDDLALKYKAEMKKEHAKSKLYTSVEEEKKAVVMKNLAKMQSSANLDLKYKFENFVVGENNRRAYGSAKMVAQNPAEKFNPLFIYGAPGLGKTHIMQAIGHYVVFNKPDLKVRYVKTVDFVNEYMSKFSPSTDGRFKNVTPEISKFRQKYRNVDVLLIDDIQFIESKTKTIEEVFHTFDYLLNKNKQIVITSDRPPKDIMLPERLTSRFIKGVVTDIKPPELDVRIKILENIANIMSLNIPNDVFEYIAQNFKTNVRELEGAFNNVITFAEIDKVPVTLDFAQSVLHCDIKKKAVTYDVIANFVAEFYGVTLKEFKSSARASKISKARQVAVYLCREITNGSYESIAEFFEKKHTTMMYSWETVKDEITKNKDLEENIRLIKNKIKDL